MPQSDAYFRARVALGKLQVTAGRYEMIAYSLKEAASTLTFQTHERERGIRAFQTKMRERLEECATDEELDVCTAEIEAYLLERPMHTLKPVLKDIGAEDY